MGTELWQWFILDQTITLVSMIKLITAAILGGLVGLEREVSGHSAGFRTNILISLGACLFTILSLHGFPVSEGSPGPQDPARVAAQIVSGVGFLGAGALLQTGNKVKGLTTAASVWLVAAIGMAVGTGALVLGIFTTVLSILALRWLLPISRWLDDRMEAQDKRREKDERDSGI